mgnify:CR=1 FL=1
MIRINNIKLKPGYTNRDLEAEIKRQLKLKTVPEYRISKLSIDDRKINDVKIIISCDILNVNEKSILKRVNNKNIMLTTPVEYIPQVTGESVIKAPPVVVGMGPAGLFAALMLARLGFNPIVFERGMDVDSRTKCVNDFWNGDTPLNPESNVLFGEGGAGTFSDGKLNSVIKDKSGRRTFVLKTFAEYGADPEILVSNKPHIGTDVLAKVVKNIRQDIIRLGGQVNFSSKLTDFTLKEDGTLNLSILKDEQITTYNTEVLILAIGHSARDTFKLLYDKGLKVEQKAFAMGVRIEHKREFINRGKYGDKPEYEKLLPTADYKFAHSCDNGRSVYSFCMCPGGFVVPAASGPHQLVVNGMSPSNRGTQWSNSGMVVEIRPEDLTDPALQPQALELIAGSAEAETERLIRESKASNGNDIHPLAVMHFQEKLEMLCWQQGNMRQTAPAQRMADFTRQKLSYDLPKSSYSPGLVSSPLHFWLPPFISGRLSKGFQLFGKSSRGFLTNEAVMIAVETRTSAPVRVTRDGNTLQHITVEGLFPCGEGAGYAGGIVSAGIDGERCAEAVAAYLEARPQA